MSIVWALIQPNASKPIGQHFIIQKGDDPKHKAGDQRGQVERRWDVSDWQLLDL